MVVLPPSGDVEFMAGTIHWCQRSYLELGALASAVPCARKHAYLVAGEWGLAELAETLELIVSEITTNAVMASARLTESRYLGQWAPGVPAGTDLALLRWPASARPGLGRQRSSACSAATRR